MKRKRTAGVLAVALAAVLIGGYFALGRFFPISDPVECPLVEAVISIDVSCNNGDGTRFVTKETEEFIQYIGNAQPTRRQSVNDYPDAGYFYAIEVKTAQRTYRYYLYEEGDFYIEMPYQGVYRSTEDFYNLVSKLFDE